ncbi:MAG TPA: 5'-nucleotidase [Gammaproteobacteria bacterium]|nr:5'-nucleotidase [Gammaproteobacteria bacterium]
MSELNRALVVAISSRALFDLQESHQIYENEGVEAYQAYQIANEHIPLPTGPAFHLVTKLLNLNVGQSEPIVEVILLSRNSADTGLRIFNSIQHYQLNITRAVFTSGQTPYLYVPAFGAHLFLSADPRDVRQALQSGYAAATIISAPNAAKASAQLRIAFDGDAVLFSDEAERIYQTISLSAFNDNEAQSANLPLSSGPFKPVLAALAHIQSLFPIEDSPIRTALVTARSAPAHERVIRTLRAWNIRLDEALFLGGLNKSEFLRAFAADVFFDDHPLHIQAAKDHVTTGHVPHGILNE